MNYARFSSPVIILGSIAGGQSPNTAGVPALASIVDRDITSIEKQIFEVAEAMPEGKCNFSPESLNFPGSSYKPNAKESSPPDSKSTRLRLAEFGIVHAFDHYGPMVGYLRMNRIVLPGSRGER